ncbi:MAG: hypothetical protein H7A24_09295 [Leptospiraceae bacterium]|nr:hypothetical protein [Leptospiraceae bacterium]MCP5512065.1 hypothetical protein [Leptospiraceae bacterium]
MALSNQQFQELKKYQRIIKQLEKIQNSSMNEDQKKRVAKDLIKYRDKIQFITPDGVPDNIQIVSLRDMKKAKKSQEGEDEKQYHNPNILTRDNVLENLIVMKASSHSTDPEINLISTLISLLETEYAPILGDSHIKFDFSHINERDNILKHLENIQRTMKVLTETIEEYALSDKQDFKEQLGRMKNKQSRIFISEAGELFINFKDFLEGINKELTQGGSIIMNLDERIHFNPRFEKSTLLEGKTIAEALAQFYEFTVAVINNINIPTKTK